MNKLKKLCGIYLFILFVAICAPSVLRTLALLLNFDYGSGYFTEGKSLITAASVSLASLIFLLITFSFAAHVPEKLRASFNSPATYIPVGAVGAALVFFATDAYLMLRNLGAPVMQLIRAKNSAAISGLALTVLAVSACVFFVANALIVEKSSLTRAFFGICTVLFLIFYFGYLYFDKTLPINAPNKIIDELAYISAASFFLFETRISLDKEYWKSYVTFGFIAATMTAYSSVPSVIVYFVNGEIISNSIFETALTFTLFIFILSRTVLALHLPEDNEDSLVTLIKKFSSQRSAELKEKHDIEKRAYLEVINRFNEVEESASEPSEATIFSASEQTDDQLSIFDESSYGGLESEIPSEIIDYKKSSEEAVEEQKKATAPSDNASTKNNDTAEESEEADLNTDQVSIFDKSSEEGTE